MRNRPKEAKVAILPILTVPHPLLTQKARPVRADEFGEALVRRLSDMAETMYAAPGVGLAGPQVGDLRRILVADLTEETDEEGHREKARHLVHVVNPVIVEASAEKIRWEEGCLSVPELWEFLERPRRVTVRFVDGLGQPQELTLEGYPAVVLQHEMDHLDGVVILDRISLLKRSRYLKKVKKTRKAEGEPAELGT